MAPGTVSDLAASFHTDDNQLLKLNAECTTIRKSVPTYHLGNWDYGISIQHGMIHEGRHYPSSVHNVLNTFCIQFVDLLVRQPFYDAVSTDQKVGDM